MFKLPSLFNFGSLPVKSIKPQPTLRRWVVDQTIIAYELKRSNRRTIGFVVNDTGLHIAAPRWITLAQIDAALETKKEWILSKLAERRARLEKRQNLPAAWEDGGQVPILGQPYKVALTNQQRSQVDHARTCLLVRSGTHSVDTAQQHIRKTAHHLLKAQARQLFKERLDFYAPQLGVQYQTMSLSSARTRWGSCTSEGVIRLHWKLIHCELAVIDYVIVHELAHLREMNHSPQFWAIVASILPDYLALRKRLKEATEALPE